jgi:hypothetical protein
MVISLPEILAQNQNALRALYFGTVRFYFLAIATIGID